VAKQPELVLEETALMLADSVDRLYEEMEYGDTSSARVGAARALSRALRDRLNLLASIGAVPGNVGAVYEYRDLKGRLDEIVRELDRQEATIPEHIRDRLIAIVDGLPHEQGEFEEVTPSWSVKQPKTRQY